MSAQQLSKQYQKKSDKQHILDNPDTYVGSVESVEDNLPVYENGKITQRQVNYIPGLFKIFDETIVNARDHAKRQEALAVKGDKTNIPVSSIDVGISDDNIITVINDGNGIDVAEHPEYKVWIPEMIFAHLRTSTNYNKDEKKIVGGKNGFGVKLAFIWSTWGRLETVDHIRKLKYVQEFEKNLDVIHSPTVSKYSGKPYTKVSFKPDYARLGLCGLTPDMHSLFKRRVYDICAVTNKTVKVKFNSEVLNVKHFQQYVDLYIGSKGDRERIYEEGGERWEYVVCISPSDEFQQISFVNGIYTSKGGKHVEYILNQIIRKLTAYISSKKKIDVKPTAIKEQLMLFLRCDIENPAFDSQTKDHMNTPSSKFGSSCTVSDKFIEKIAKMGVMQTACQISDAKSTKNAQKTDGNKTKNIRGIPKLVDANLAGTKKGKDCTIIFCEGDSAKAGIMSGLTTNDRNTFGIYPMRGKLFNVRGETRTKIHDNKEISEIKQILGLVTGKEYKTREDVEKNLRYGRILFMTDQDLDGSHIKGLGLNLFETEWPSLIEVPGFIGYMNTPILKATKGKSMLKFYNDGEYTEWKSATDTKGWNIKYYKGLGTSTSKEFKEYFADKKFISFASNGTPSRDILDMVFNKKRPDDRKEWLGNYDRNTYLDTGDSSISYEDFVNKELIHFSKYDCDRSIANIMDGLKISLRKILFSTFKRRLTSEIKVAQLSGYVSEHSGYHHGEASLNGGIIGMAQNFVGSNNINLLVPNGQFGTRLAGGKDSASERYIFTLLNTITRHIFPEHDDAILEYLDDDGQSVEPIYYVPIIPMILINGSEGIGTGFSSKVLPYKPTDIIEWLEHKIRTNEGSGVEFVPYYHGFKGSIMKISDQKFLVKGCYKIISDTSIEVSELPVGYWTDDFKSHIESLMDEKGQKKAGIVKDYNDNSTDTTVSFIIHFHKGVMEKLQQKYDENSNQLEKQLKLVSTLSTTNMHLFNSDDKLHKYSTVEEILEDYFKTRLEVYVKRKQHQLKILKSECDILNNKTRYITELLNDTIDLRKKKLGEINDMLEQKGYMKKDDNYKYLIKMPMDSVSEENVKALTSEMKAKQEEHDNLLSTREQEIWLGELHKLRKQYDTQYNSSKGSLDVPVPDTQVVAKKKSPTKKIKLNK